MTCQLHLNKLFKIKGNLKLGLVTRVTIWQISKLCRKTGLYLHYSSEFGDSMLKWTFLKNMLSKPHN